MPGTDVSTLPSICLYSISAQGVSFHSVIPIHRIVEFRFSKVPCPAKGITALISAGTRYSFSFSWEK
ncbi:MAG TPA: hypothetical protein DCY35_11550 [Prolixibacteraceae bacterium]|nr:hypothetical protein [Prolixibacteraceae bacterium]